MSTQQRTASSPLASRRILVVDDTATIRALLEAALTDAGAVTSLAEDGEAALRAVETATPDLILLDLVMPRLDGWGVIERLRRSPRTAAIPVILQTSAEDYPSFDRARRDGVAAFISKPFRLHEVIETCRRVFAGARPLQGATAPDRGLREVEVRRQDGILLMRAELTDLDAEGAQLELAAPLPLGELVLLGPLEPGQPAIQAEVRWVTCLGSQYSAGLLFRRDH